MKNKIIATLTIILMALSPISLLAGGAEIDFTDLEEGAIVNTKVLDVVGTAQPTPDQWLQDNPEDLNQGSLDNITINDEGDLEVFPYIEDFGKDQNNPLVDFGANFSFNEYGSHLGGIIKDGNTYKMWSMGENRSSEWNLGYSTSNDGSSFNTQNGTLSLGGPGAFDNVSIDPGTIIKDGSTYKMWYTGEDVNGIYRIGYATSTDGVTWTKGGGGKAVLDIGPINKFDGGSVATPTVIKDGNIFKMWYSGLIAYSGNLWQIGYATSNNGVDWNKQNNNDPIISFGKSTAFDKDGVWGASVIKDGNIYRMWYIGVPTPAVGYATSTDGLNWHREFDGAPILGIGGSGAFDEKALTSIIVLRDGNKYKMYYSGMDNTNSERIGLATADLEGLTGIYISNFYDAGIKVFWKAVELVYDTPSGTSLDIETRASDDRVEWTSWASLIDGSSPYEEARYYQYKLTMVSPDGLSLPTFSSFKIYYEAIERVEVSTDNSTWFLATGSYEWNATMYLKEGLNTIFVRVIDTTDVPTYTALNLNVDTILPTGIVQIYSDAMYTTSPTVDLTLAAIDASGVVEMRFATTEVGLENGTWLPYSSTHTIDLIDEDGTQSVFCQLKDSTGLVSKVISDSIILDTSTPNGTVSIMAGAPMTTFLDVVLSLTATDANGLDKMRISNDANFTDAEWKTYAAVSDWTLETGDDVKTVYVEYMDNAGMTRVFTDDIILDTKAPTGSISVNGGDEITMSRYVVLNMDGNDENGVSHVMISNEPDFLDSFWMTFNETMEWTLRERIGPQTVFVKFKDTAGLVSQTYSDEIVLDIHEEGFEGTILINDGDEVTGNQTLTLTLSLIGDDGFSTVMLSEENDFKNADWQAYNETVTYTTTMTDGKVRIYAQFMDKYGFISEVVTDDIVVDMTAPFVEITSPADSSKTTNQLLTLTGTAFDDVGLQTVEIQLPNGQWIPVDNNENYTSEIHLIEPGEHTITVRAIDTAGNTNTSSITIKYREKKGDDTTPGFEATALVFSTLLVILYLSRRRSLRV